MTSKPLVTRTFATLRSAEFGFVGVVVYTRVQTPRFCGEACRAGTLLRAFSGCRGLAINWLIVGIVALRYLHREPLWARKFTIARDLAGPAFARIADASNAVLARKTEMRHPLEAAGAPPFGSTRGGLAAPAIASPDKCCQRQRLSFIGRGVCAGRGLGIQNKSQRLGRAAVPNRRSSPPAEKCGVCIGASRLSQGEKPGKSGRSRGIRAGKAHIITRSRRFTLLTAPKCQFPGSPAGIFGSHPARTASPPGRTSAERSRRRFRVAP